VQSVASLRNAVDLLIYLSVALGVVLLPQLYGLVPSWLFLSVLVGWVAYLIVAVLVLVKRRSIAYPLAFVLALLTLMVSLPQPAHYSYVEAGPSLASATFLLGSAVQLSLVILIPLYLYRHKSSKT